MSVRDMYPANQWRYRQNHPNPPPHHHHPPPHHHHPPPHHRHHSQPYPHYNRPPPPRYPRRRGSMPLVMGPRTGMMALMNLLSPAPPPRYHNHPPPHYPASAPPIIIDILKTGSMDIEYNVIIKYYRRKYFELKSDSKLYYYSSQSNTHKKADGVINLLTVISLKKVDKIMFEIEVNNKTDGVDVVKLLTPDITIWRFKCNSTQERNDWFDCIRCFVSQNKNVVYMERKHGTNDENKEDESWCVVEKKNEGIFSKILSKKKVMDNGLDLDATEPQEPGMVNGNNQEDEEYIPPPAFANMEGNNDHIDYADEGKVTFQ